MHCEVVKQLVNKIRDYVFNFDSQCFWQNYIADLDCNKQLIVQLNNLKKEVLLYINNQNEPSDVEQMIKYFRQYTQNNNVQLLIHIFELCSVSYSENGQKPYRKTMNFQILYQQLQNVYNYAPNQTLKDIFSTKESFMNLINKQQIDNKYQQIITLAFNDQSETYYEQSHDKLFEDLINHFKEQQKIIKLHEIFNRNYIITSIENHGQGVENGIEIKYKENILSNRENLCNLFKQEKIKINHTIVTYHISKQKIDKTPDVYHLYDDYVNQLNDNEKIQKYVKCMTYEKPTTSNRDIQFYIYKNTKNCQYNNDQQQIQKYVPCNTQNYNVDQKGNKYQLIQSFFAVQNAQQVQITEERIKIYKGEYLQNECGIEIKKCKFSIDNSKFKIFCCNCKNNNEVMYIHMDEQYKLLLGKDLVQEDKCKIYIDSNPHIFYKPQKNILTIKNTIYDYHIQQLIKQTEVIQYISKYFIDEYKDRFIKDIFTSEKNDNPYKLEDVLKNLENELKFISLFHQHGFVAKHIGNICVIDQKIYIIVGSDTKDYYNFIIGNAENQENYKLNDIFWILYNFGQYIIYCINNLEKYSKYSIDQWVINDKKKIKHSKTIARQIINLYNSKILVDSKFQKVIDKFITKINKILSDDEKQKKSDE